MGINTLNITPKQKDFLSKIVVNVKDLQQQNNTINPRVITAQAILESGWGESRLAHEYRNLFGIKAGTQWRGDKVNLDTQEVIKGYVVNEGAFFRVYATLVDSFADYVDFIQQSPYFSEALAYPDDDEKYLDVLVGREVKYATDPHYKQLILDIITTLNLGNIFPRHTVQ